MFSLIRRFVPYTVAAGSTIYAFASRQKLKQEIQHLEQTVASLKSKQADRDDFMKYEITESKKVEEIQARLSAIVEYSDDAIVSKTLEGIIVSWNKGAEKIFGYSREEAIGQSIRMLFPVDRLHEEDDFLRRLSKGEHIDHFETVRLRKDGRPIDISVTLSPIRDAEGKVIGISKIARDITERKLAEEVQVRLSAIVEFSDDAIISKTLDGIILSWNKGAKKIFGYSEEETIGQSIRMLFPPERLYEEDDFLRRLSQGEHIDHFETVRVRKDGQKIDISVTLSPIQNVNGRIIGVSKVAQNITERKRDERRMKLLLELATLFSQALTSWQIAELMVEQGSRALGAMASTVCLLVEHGTMLEMLNVTDLIEQPTRMPLDFPGPLNEAVRTGKVVWIESTQDYINRYPYFTEALQEVGKHSIICLPLKVDEKIIGGFSLAFPINKQQNADEEAFFLAIANQCAQSLERTRLYEAERRERNLADALRDIVVALNSTWDLSKVFDQILNNINRVISHDMADIMLIEDGYAKVIRSQHYAEHGLVATEQDMQNFSIYIADTHHIKWVTENGQPSIIRDTQKDPTWIKVHEPDIIRSTLIVPIVIEGRVVGFVNVNSLTPNFYTTKDGDRLQAFADQAAIAIRNAQLYQRDLKIAAVEERQRIERDLHDSVSQTLFSANIIAEMLPRLWENQPAKAMTQAHLLHQLTRGAAAEMRVLLIELRPESLVNTQLKDILTQLGYALLGRLDIQLDIVIRDQTNQLLPPEVQVAFYRIAQESLNNIVKYAQPKQVKIRLTRIEKRVTLSIIDNGEGFDTNQVTGGLGLKSMQERAAKIGAALRVRSRVGRGTRIQLIWEG